jgi:hypothetical protein
MMAAVEVFGVEELAGWRAWRLIGDRYRSGTSWRPAAMPRFLRLESATQTTDQAGVDGVWPTNRWLEARCLVNHRHNEKGSGIPVEACTCGVYAAKTLAQLRALPYAFNREGVVVGEVGFAGKVIEGSQGWRGERARVRRLWLPHGLWMYVEPLEQAYRVPVGFARVVRGEIVLDEDVDEMEVL